MSALQHISDDCTSAADVLARASEVRRRRAAMYAAPKPPPRRFISMSGKVVGRFPLYYPTADAERFSILGIQLAVCRAAGITKTDLLARRQDSRTSVRPRHVAMMLCKSLTQCSYPEIGAKFERDHTTVLTAVRNMARVEEVVRLRVRPGASIDEWVKESFRAWDEIVWPAKKERTAIGIKVRTRNAAMKGGKQ